MGVDRTSVSIGRDLAVIGAVVVIGSFLIGAAVELAMFVGWL